MKYVMFCLFLLSGCVSTPKPTPEPKLQIKVIRWAHTPDMHCPVSNLDEFHRKLATQSK